MRYFRSLNPEIKKGLVGGGSLAGSVYLMAYVMFGITSGHWSIPKQLEYYKQHQKLHAEFMRLADRDNDGQILHGEIQDARERAGLETDKTYIFLTDDVMERVIESYREERR